MEQLYRNFICEWAHIDISDADAFRSRAHNSITSKWTWNIFAKKKTRKITKKNGAIESNGVVCIIVSVEMIWMVLQLQWFALSAPSEFFLFKSNEPLNIKATLHVTCRISKSKTWKMSSEKWNMEFTSVSFLRVHVTRFVWENRFPCYILAWA